MRSVRLFDYIQSDGDSFQIIAQKGSQLSLKSLTTNRIRHVGVTELLSDDSYEPDAPVLDDVAVLDSLDDGTREETLWLYKHIYEIVHGTPPLVSMNEAAPEIKLEYSPDHLLRDKVEAKAEELVSTERPLSSYSLHRYVLKYKHRGIEGLVDGRKRRQTNPGRDQDPRLIALIQEETAAQETISTGTRKRAITRVTVKAKDLGIPVPTSRTLNRLIAAEMHHSHAFEDATLRQTQANRPKRTYGRRAPFRPGELVEIDSTRLDLMVVLPDGTTGRPELTSMIDVATRTVSTAVLFPGSTTSIDVAALVLARSLTPLPMQPEWAEELALSRSALPAGMIEPDATLHSSIAARPLIYPATITIDRGRVYTGSVFQSACDRLQISIIPAPPGTPTVKPHIERLFKSVHEGLIQYLLGYVGRSTNHRGQAPSAEAYWTLSEVQSLLDQWPVQEWQNTPRKGLTVPAMPKKALSPNEMYAALSTISPTPAVALTRDDYISLLPMSFRSIQAYGINFAGLTYDSPDLHPYRAQPSGLVGRAKDRWEVRAYPARMNRIFVRDHHKRRWIEARWHLDSHTLGSFSGALLKAVRKDIARQNRTIPQHSVLEGIIRVQSGIGVTGVERAASQRRSTSTVPELDPLEKPKSSESPLNRDAYPPDQKSGRQSQSDLPDRLL